MTHDDWSAEHSPEPRACFAALLTQASEATAQTSRLKWTKGLVAKIKLRRCSPNFSRTSMVSTSAVTELTWSPADMSVSTTMSAGIRK